MKIDILTLFPNMFKGPFDESMILSAKKKKLVHIKAHDLRRWGIDKRGSVDDRTYGGGKGMLIRVDVIAKAVNKVTKRWGLFKKKNLKVVLLDAGGVKFTQKKALELSKLENLVLIAGHYEGIDHRVHEQLVDEIISIGDYVLTGGEIPAMVLVDSIVRLIPGVLEEEATQIESHTTEGLLEYPQYTRPVDYKGWKVPKVLLFGNHKEIAAWRTGKYSSKASVKE